MTRPVSVTITVALVVVVGLAWLAFAVAMLAGLIRGLTPALQITFAGLAAGTAGALLFAAAGLRRGSRLAYVLALGILILVAVLSITDQMGLGDWVSLALSAIPGLLLIKDRRWYWSG